jgi:tagatose-1,6-bisphosphate aldolase non-catalytic subunit AgaZ/GatZ
MKNLNNLVRAMIERRESGAGKMTLLAVCPNSSAVLEAAIQVAAENNAPLLFAATLNQVDRDGGYTGWTPAQFVLKMQTVAQSYGWDGPLYPCLDHGGPWLKDQHTLVKLSFEETIDEVKQSLAACVAAGYQLLHIDPTVDRTLPQGQPVPIQTIVDRTVELISFAEQARAHLGLPEIAYEVGSEEVHGGLVELDKFESFLKLLKEKLAAAHLSQAWPAFVVAQVGTDLHTTAFNAATAEKLYQIVHPYGSLIKGHYSDWVENPAAYPDTGMGGANVGPELTREEYLALQDLTRKELDLCRNRHAVSPSHFMQVLERAVVDSGRWMKWLQAEESGQDFYSLSEPRRAWLAQTGARYVWTYPEVQRARQALYANLSSVQPDPHAYVVDRIGRAMDRYMVAFHLYDALTFAEPAAHSPA